MIRATIALTVCLALLSAAAAGAATLEPIGSFAAPIYVTSDPGNGNRLFVVERGGLVEQVEDGTVTTFADLRAQVGCGGACENGERGLLSIAMAPDFDSSGRFFVDYTSELDGSINVAEMRAAGGSAPISSLRPLLTNPHPGASNHYGGQLQFGPEGDLFISTGDGGGENDQFENAQSLTSLLGKILRIDPDPGALLPYTVPAGNPFPEATPPYETIWSYGLRNPFRFSFDSGGGGIWIGDVGQNAREEIDHGAAPGLGGGGDYGWNCFEGRLPGPEPDPGCSEPHTFTGPVFDYPHSGAPSGGAEGCAVIGGYVVRDPGLGELYGRYLYGDLCGGDLRSFAPANPYGSDRATGLSVANLNSFGEDACGRLYAVSGDGVVSRLVGSQPTPCPALAPLPLKPSHAGIRALRRRVKRGRRAVVTVWVSPCAGRSGEKVKLFRGRRSLGAHRLGRACTARFLPRIHRRSDFRARIESDATFEAAVSRRLAIKPRRRRH